MKRTKPIGVGLCCAAVLALLWWLAPTRFLWLTTPQNIQTIQVTAEADGSRFVITDPADIRYLMTQIRQTPFQKTGFSGKPVRPGYHLTFCKANGRAVSAFSITAADEIHKGLVRYRCLGGASLAGAYLETLQALLPPVDAASEPAGR